MTTQWNGGRPPPNYTRTLYNAHILYDSHLRWDGITVIEPDYDPRTIPVTVLTNGRPQIGEHFTWGSLHETWGNAHYLWGAVNSYQTEWDNGRIIP